MKNILIIGGTSGLGCELAKKYLALGNNVIVSGRSEPEHLNEGIEFKKLDISYSQVLMSDIKNFINEIQPIDILVYSAGIFHRGLADELSDDEIIQDAFVNSISFQIIMSEFLKKQKTLSELVAISSVAQFRTPKDEIHYSANKTAFGKYVHILSLDDRIGKTLLVSPAGMNTPFWKNHPKTSELLSEYLDPVWVAENIITLAENESRFESYLINRNPPSIEKRT